MVYFLSSRSRLFHSWGRYHCRWGSSISRPPLSSCGLWAGRDVYRATPAVTRDLGLSSLIWGTPCSVASYAQTGIELLRTHSNPDPHGAIKLEDKLKIVKYSFLCYQRLLEINPLIEWSLPKRRTVANLGLAAFSPIFSIKMWLVHIFIVRMHVLIWF